DSPAAVRPVFESLSKTAPGHRRDLAGTCQISLQPAQTQDEMSSIVRKLLVTVTGWPALSVPVAVTVYDSPVSSAHVLCQFVPALFSDPVTASQPVLTVTFVILAPWRALTVMPPAVLALAVPAPRLFPSAAMAVLDAHGASQHFFGRF